MTRAGISLSGLFTLAFPFLPLLPSLSRLTLPPLHRAALVLRLCSLSLSLSLCSLSLDYAAEWADRAHEGVP